MEVLNSNKGRVKIIFQGNMYTKHYEGKDSINWRCVRRAYGCKGTMKTSLNQTQPRPGNDHNHDIDQVGAEIAKARQEMKMRASTTHDTPKQIYTDTVRNLPREVQASLPSRAVVRRTLLNQRRGPAEPDSLADLVLDPEFTMTEGPNPAQFLLYDNGPQAQSRIIAFATEECLAHFANAELCYMDGNFAMSPKLFKQLYIVRVPLGLDNESVDVTVVYAFLQRKTKAIYVELFQAILDKVTELGLQPRLRTIVTDFEIAVMQASDEVFPPHRHQGCFYHLTQATWRKIQELGLIEHYRDTADFRHFVGMLDGLAFLPEVDIERGFDYLRNIAPPQANGLLEYFERTYVRGPVHQRQGQQFNMRYRLPPIFPPRTWNVNEATIDGNPRTNNSCESWNFGFLKQVGHYHPTFWKALQNLKAEQSAVEVAISQFLIGNPPKKEIKRVYRDLQHRLRNLCVDLRDGRRDMAQFLQAISHNIRPLRILNVEPDDA
ncbi:uncharacterized protein LOC121417108 [Lytechinus variegatus]|uniref:uncharacterized protein LOC121417108 n=1 Tax=Lytechinus variegatus TaxID=7654 RepID=UPI001BB2C467|nr:uncharacterized protein LOC121417108 [Lytechinus variegatus]